MIRHYLKQAIRNFWATKIIVGGSIVTVVLGGLCISLLATYVYNELSMNNFHHREKDIFITIIQASPESQWEAINPTSFFKFNYKEYPEIINLVNITKYNEGEVKFIYGKNSFSPEGIVADSTFFQIFDFKLKVGDEKTVLSDLSAVLFSEQFAEKMFGDENPIGKTVKFKGSVEKVFTVKGIIESLPSNSSITFDFILPNNASDYDKMSADFLLVGSGFDKSAFIKKIENLGQGHPQFTKSKMSLVGLDDVYFNWNAFNFVGIFSKFGDKENLDILYIIIIILLIISALNFSNLQVININASIKNIGINKIIGAGTWDLIHQKAIEVLLLIYISFLLLTGAYIAILPYFNKITGVLLSPKLFDILMVNGLVLFALTLVAMIYPSFIFSRIPITLSLSRQVFAANKLLGRQVIVSIQFALSIFLLVSSIVVVKQLHMMVDKDLGFNSRNIINTQLFHRIAYNGPKEERMKHFDEQQKSFQYVTNELESNPSIDTYSQGLSPLKPFPMPWNLQGGKTDFTTQNVLTVYPNHPLLLGLKITEGRFFDNKKDKSREFKVVINEAAKKFWGIEDISQSRLLNKYWMSDKGYEIIGVVKDFNYEHLSVKPQPLMMVYFQDVNANFLIKFKEGDVQAGLQFVQQLHSEINPGEIFQFTFLADEVAAFYKKEKQLSQIYILFTLIALMISTIGLFSIALYEAQKRTKEIGIRKVNGAKISEILVILNRDFLRWVFMAFVVATPIAWVAMNKWLESFAYKTDLSWWIFALAGLLAIAIALITVSWQSWKAATRNPVEALRYE